MFLVIHPSIKQNYSIILDNVFHPLPWFLNKPASYIWIIYSSFKTENHGAIIKNWKEG